VSLVADINLGYAGSLMYPMRELNNTFYFYADDGVHSGELWRLDPTSQLVRLTNIARQGNDLELTWTSPGGLTNVLQTADGAAGEFADCSGPLLAPAGGLVSLNYVGVGGATNSARYFRVRLP